MNLYHLSKFQDEKKDQRNFTAHMAYHPKKKALEHPVSKKPKLSRAQEEEEKKSSKSKYNMNISTEKKHIENNRTVLPFLANKTPVPLHVTDNTSTVPNITTIKIYILKK